MEKKSHKLILTGAALLGVLALAGLGTFAVFTLSKKGTAGGLSVTMADSQWPLDFIEQTEGWEPQTVGDLLGGDWTKNLTLQPVRIPDPTQEDPDRTKETTVGDCYELRPISTANGIDWYLPNYDNTGSLTGLSHLSSDEFEAVANVNRFDTTAKSGISGVATNYVYYFDIWIRTDQEKEYELKLNNPLEIPKDEAGLRQEGTSFFGTFVLPGLVKKTLEGGAVYIPSTEGANACRSVRIGFMTYDYTDEAGNRLERSQITAGTPLYKEETVGETTVKTRLEKPREFWILEPNCDDRAVMTEYAKNTTESYTKQSEDGVSYLVGAGGSNVALSTFAGLSAGDIPTLLPVYSVPAGGTASTEFKADNVINAANPLLSPDEPAEDDEPLRTHILKQTKSEWEQNLTTGEVNSSDIKTLGAFLPLAQNGTAGTDTPGYEGIDTPVMTVVGKTAPQHVRIFIWLEGQDVDCWDSTLNGEMLINLEFRGDLHEKVYSEGN